MKAQRKAEKKHPEERRQTVHRLITEMSAKNGILTITVDLNHPTKKTFGGNDLYSAKEIASFGNGQELFVRFFALKRPVREPRFAL